VQAFWTKATELSSPSFQNPTELDMPAASFRVLSQFFQEHLHFTPTPGQVELLESDLALVSPDLMEAALKEVSESHALAARHVKEFRGIIFRVYNRKVAEHQQLFSIFHTFETAFRSTVSVNLEAYYGRPDWWAVIYHALRKGASTRTVPRIGCRSLPKDTAHLIGEIIYYIDGEALQRNRIPKLPDGYALTQHCKLSHIGKLVTEHWCVFQAQFVHGARKLTLTDFRDKFRRVCDARNEVYHHRSFNGMTKAVLSAEELLDRLDYSLGFVYQKIASARVLAPKFAIAIETRHHAW
jgi:hypothetical protein